MSTNKAALLENVTYEDFEQLVLETGAFNDEIIADYILDVQEGLLNGMVTGSVSVPSIQVILKENGPMYFEMLSTYYLG